MARILTRDALLEAGKVATVLLAIFAVVVAAEIVVNHIRKKII